MHRLRRIRAGLRSLEDVGRLETHVGVKVRESAPVYFAASHTEVPCEKHGALVLGRRGAEVDDLTRLAEIAHDQVARVRRDRADGRSLRAIANVLNFEAVPTGQGGARWRASSVSAVLTAAERSEQEAS